MTYIDDMGQAVGLGMTSMIGLGVTGTALKMMDRMGTGPRRKKARRRRRR